MVMQMMAGVKAKPSQWMRLGGEPWSWWSMRMETSRQARRSRVQRIPANAQAEKTEGVGEGKGPGRIAHDEDGAGVKAGGVLDGPDGVAVVGIAVVDELAAGGPVRKEVATGSQFACNRDSEDVEDGDGKRQAGDTGNRNFSEVAALMCWRKIQLADHGRLFYGSCRGWG